MKKALIWNFAIALGIFSALSAARAAEPVQAVRTHNDFSFVVFSETDDGNTVIYNTDSVEQKTREMLAQMGATNVQVYVSGGMDELVRDPLVEVQFDSIRVASQAQTGTPLLANWTQVSLKGSDNGYLARGIIDGVKDHFEVKNLQGSLNGFDPDMGYSYQLSTLFAQ